MIRQLGLVLLSIVSLQAAAPDIVIADFEGSDYGAWKTTGEAFGAGPARGSLPGQMNVSGFEGKGLVNSFLRGDATTGTLTSPLFKIERKSIRFLIGGGNHPKETCINLIVNNQVVRTTPGTDSEHLDWIQWDVSDLAGKEAKIQIVDENKGGWGHINIDQITQTDRALPGLRSDASREIVAEKKYLNLPVKNGAPKRLMTVKEGGKIVRQFQIELADATPDWWAFLELKDFKGKKLTLVVDHLKEDSSALQAMEQSDRIKGGENMYREKLRPQFHFTSRRGWNNDPNGLVYYDGEYHMFYQHNPYGWNWGNMHWGQAVSKDLVHWEELGEALYPDELGTMFSGSAVVDEYNTAGLQKGREKTIVLLYTAAGNDSVLSKGQPFTQCMAYSNDRGRTWIKYEKNPVLPHVAGSNRDPKVIWYEADRKWIMALYLDKEDFALYDSRDLKNWRELQRITIPGSTECPEFFQIGDDKKWVIYGGNGLYLVGTFDGKKFTKESGPHSMNYGNCFYASQTFNLSKKDKRRILVPWGQINLPGMPFNQMMGIPVELNLRNNPAYAPLWITPIKEL